MKRLFDIIVSFSALVILSPLMGVVALLVLLKMGRPIFFTQMRPGRDGNLFRMVKFRTMTVAFSNQGGVPSDGARLTPLGRWLRGASLDELPELWNILRGEMSLVGPRPLLPQYLDRYTPRQGRRHEVRPGLTGYAQINGRNALTWDEKLELDVWYVDNRSFMLDLVIIWRTIRQVLRRDGISAEGEATMSEFMGTSETSR